LTGLVIGAALLQSARAGPLLQSSPSAESEPTLPATALRDDLTMLQRGELPADTAATLPSATLPAAAYPLPAAGPDTMPGAVPQDNPPPTLHSTLKETVRPLYNELEESGALQTWREVKADLGLQARPWEHEPPPERNLSDASADPTAAPTWNDPARPPLSAAQERLNREYEAYVLQELIDEIKPWAIGALALYAVGYVIKRLFDFLQWNAARRRERRAKRHHRHHRRSHRSPSGDGGAA